MTAAREAAPTSAGDFVVVTGAARGIGLAVCEALRARGVEVVAAVRDPAAGDLRAAPGLQVIGCDVAQASAVAALFAALAQRPGRLLALVNNAGVITPIGRIADTDPAQWAHAQSVNLVGAYHCVRAALPRMLDAGGGAIVKRVQRRGPAPAGRLVGLLRVEGRAGDADPRDPRGVRAQGIHAVGLLPGVVDTGMQQQIRDSGLNRVSRLPRSTLAPAELPRGRSPRCGCGAAPRFAGREVDVRDPQAAAELLG